MIRHWILAALALAGSGTTPAGAVPAETPPAALAFAARGPGDARRLVIAHYFPTFLVVLGRWDGAGDYYEAHYLRPEGEGGKFRAGGGFVRERPLVPAGGIADPAAGLRLDVARAARIGIDAFGVDILDLDCKTWAVALGLLDAASAGGPAFRIVAEPDIYAMPWLTAERLTEALLTFARHPAAMRLKDGRLLVMPFAAERQPPEFWRKLSRIMAEAGTPIALVPDFVDGRNQEVLAPLSYAAAIWGGRDRYAAAGQAQFAGWTRRAGYSGWFATAAPQDMRPKSLMLHEAGGSEALLAQLQAAIDGGAMGLHLVTWNDYAEGTEIAPSSVTRHAYYDLAAWGIAAFKAGAPPRIERDGFLVFHRRQIFNAGDVRRGQPWRVEGRAPVVNVVDTVAFLTAPATLTVTVGGVRSVRKLAAGMQRLTVPARVGRVTVRLTRSGQALATCTSPWRIAAEADHHDPLYGGFSSLRGCN